MTNISVESNLYQNIHKVASGPLVQLYTHMSQSTHDFQGRLSLPNFFASMATTRPTLVDDEAQTDCTGAVISDYWRYYSPSVERDRPSLAEKQ